MNKNRLLPKGSVIHNIRGKDYHIVKFWYLPETMSTEKDVWHLMGKCRNCKKWSIKK